MSTPTQEALSLDPDLDDLERMANLAAEGYLTDDAGLSPQECLDLIAYARRLKRERDKARTEAAKYKAHTEEVEADLEAFHQSAFGAPEGGL